MLFSKVGKAQILFMRWEPSFVNSKDATTGLHSFHQRNQVGHAIALSLQEAKT
jgi:hypothetical protein